MVFEILFKRVPCRKNILNSFPFILHTNFAALLYRIAHYCKLFLSMFNVYLPSVLQACNHVKLTTTTIKVFRLEQCTLVYFSDMSKWTKLYKLFHTNGHFHKSHFLFEIKLIWTMNCMTFLLKIDSDEPRLASNSWASFFGLLHSIIVSRYSELFFTRDFHFPFCF